MRSLFALVFLAIVHRRRSSGAGRGDRACQVHLASDRDQGWRHAERELAGPAAAAQPGRGAVAQRRHARKRRPRQMRQRSASWPSAQRASRARRLRKARRIEFEQPSWDKYGGRIDADVWIDGDLLSDQLIAAGLARRYDGGKRRRLVLTGIAPRGVRRPSIRDSSAPDGWRRRPSRPARVPFPD